MSQRLGSSINSSLFMSDPVPVRTVKSNNQQEQIYFVKGEDTSKPADTYEHLGGEDDVFIINSNEGSFQFHRKTLRDILTELKADSHLSVKQLSPQHTESFRSVVEALRLLYNSSALYDIVLTDVRDIFSDVTNVRPGTVAAFFIGCFNDDKFSGPMGCGPKCAASLPPSEGTPGYANCEDLVLIYQDNMFSSLNDVRSKHAFIYIDDNNFSGFTQDNINQLNDAGIETSSLIFGNPDGSYREITSATNITALPQVTVQQNSTINNNSGSSAFIAIIIVIIIVIALWLLFTFWLRPSKQY